MTDGHGVSSSAARQETVLRILMEIQAEHGVSQRALASGAGVALGLTNSVLRDFIRHGWVRVSHQSGGIRYSMTPEGLAECNRIEAARLAQSARYYAEARDKVRDRLVALSTERGMNLSRGNAKRLALYGVTDLAEIAYVCLQTTDLTVTTVFDGDGSRHFFDARVRPLSELRNRSAWRDFDVLLVTAFEEHERRTASERLREASFPIDRVVWL